MQNYCRSCGFEAHKPEDLIDGACPRWAAGDQALADHTAAACDTITKAATA